MGSLIRLDYGDLNSQDKFQMSELYSEKAPQESNEQSVRNSIVETPVHQNSKSTKKFGHLSSKSHARQSNRDGVGTLNSKINIHDDSEKSLAESGSYQSPDYHQ